MRGDEGQAVEQEGPAACRRAVISTPATAGPTRRADWKLAEFRLTALRSCAGPTISDDEGLPGRVVHDGDQAEQEGDEVDVPDLDVRRRG